MFRGFDNNSQLSASQLGPEYIDHSLIILFAIDHRSGQVCSALLQSLPEYVQSLSPALSQSESGKENC